MTQTVMRLEGDKALIRALGKLNDSTQRKIVKSAVTRGSQPWVKAARQEAPSGPDDGKSDKKKLKKGIGKKVKKYPSGAIVAIVGNVLEAFHAHLVEFGTTFRFHKSGKYVGVMPANPFMRRAYDRTKREVVRKTEQFAWKGIEKEAAKLGRQSRGKR